MISSGLTGMAAGFLVIGMCFLTGISPEHAMIYGLLVTNVVFSLAALVKLQKMERG